MPRKDIDLEEQHIAQLDRVRADRRVSYSDVVKAALDEYFAPKPTPISEVLADRLDGTRSALDQIQQRLWSLDSASQKSTERLAAIETQLDGLHGVIEHAMELLILIGERLASPPAENPEPIKEPVQRTMPPPVEEDPITDIYHDPRSQWYIPPPKVTERRGWFGRKGNA
jgi:hypothetical protein